MDSHTHYLVTGAGRGLGLGLVKALLLRPHTVVIAATRSPAAPALAALPAHPGSRLIAVTIDSAAPTSALAAAQDLRAQHGITRLDVVIANAGVSAAPAPVAAVSPDAIQACLAVNTVAPLLPFQATLPLLAQAAAPKFAVVSSVAGSLGAVDGYASPCAAYGVSKAAVNFLVRRMGRENEGLVALALHPGWIQTDMGNAAAARLGKTEAPVAVATAVEGILKEIDLATKETSKAFYTYDHQVLPW